MHHTNRTLILKVYMHESFDTNTKKIRHMARIYFHFYYSISLFSVKMHVSFSLIWTLKMHKPDAQNHKKKIVVADEFWKRVLIWFFFEKNKKLILLFLKKKGGVVLKLSTTELVLRNMCLLSHSLPITLVKQNICKTKHKVPRHHTQNCRIKWVLYFFFFL